MVGRLQEEGAEGDGEVEGAQAVLKTIRRVLKKLELKKSRNFRRNSNHSLQKVYNYAAQVVKEGNDLEIRVAAIKTSFSFVRIQKSQYFCLPPFVHHSTSYRISLTRERGGGRCAVNVGDLIRRPHFLSRDAPPVF